MHWQCSNCPNELNDAYFNTNSDNNKLYVKIANLVHEGTTKTIIWEALRQSKLSWTLNMLEHLEQEHESSKSDSKERKTYVYDELFRNVLENLNIHLKNESNSYTEVITDDDLASAAEMFIFLTAPTQEFWKKVFGLYSNHFLPFLSPKRIIGFF